MSFENYYNLCGGIEGESYGSEPADLPHSQSDANFSTLSSPYPDVYNSIGEWSNTGSSPAPGVRGIQAGRETYGSVQHNRSITTNTRISLSSYAGSASNPIDYPQHYYESLSTTYQAQPASPPHVGRIEHSTLQHTGAFTVPRLSQQYNDNGVPYDRYDHGRSGHPGVYSPQLSGVPTGTNFLSISASRGNQQPYETGSRYNQLSSPQQYHASQPDTLQPASTSPLNQHGLPAGGNRPYRCDFLHCTSKGFSSLQTLNRHKRDKHSGRVFSCSICGTEFADSTSVPRHEAKCLLRSKNNMGVHFGVFAA